MTHALVLSGGPGHPVSATAPSLIDLLGPDTEVTDDVDAGLDRLDGEVHDLLVVNALAFEMRDGRYDERARQDHAFHLGEPGREAIEAWVGAGSPILALHTAVICFGDWDRWRTIVGGAWDWGKSSHPPVGPVDVAVSLPALADFSVVDERYTDLTLEADIEVVATAADVPVAWRRVEGRGIGAERGARVACSTLGHDRRSLDDPGHRGLLRSLVDWLLEDPCRT